MKKHTLFTSLIIIILNFFINQFVFAQKIEIKNGVRYIQNEGKGLWAEKKNVKIEFIGTLGDLEGENENYMFFLPKKITDDRDGNIYVLDSGNHRVQKFDKNLKYVCTIGRNGQGPGEFLTPDNIDVDLNGNINIFDYGNIRIQTFSPDGEYLGGTRVKETNFFFRYLSTSEILLKNPAIGRYRAEKDDVPLFYVLNSDLKRKRKIGQSTYYPGFHRRFPGINNFTYSIDDLDNIYLSYYGQNRIEKYSYDGKLIFSMNRPVSKELNWGSRKPPFTPNKTIGIDTDSEGRIWVLTYRKDINKKDRAGIGLRTENGITSYYVWGNPEIKEADNYCLELFNSEGILLKVFLLNHWATNLKIIQNKIYIIDMLRGMQCYIYTITQ